MRSPACVILRFAPHLANLQPCVGNHVEAGGHLVLWYRAQRRWPAQAPL